MRRKSVFVFMFVFCLVFVFASGFVFAGTKEFSKGFNFLTPQVGINSYTIPFGANFEHAVTPNVGIGGTVMTWFWSDPYWSNTIIAFSADAAYHFTKIRAEKVDLYAGAGVGVTVYSWKWKSGFEDWLEGSSGSTGLYIQPFVGGRYFFSPKMAVNLRLNVAFLGDWGGFGGLLGVAFRI